MKLLSPYVFVTDVLLKFKVGDILFTVTVNDFEVITLPALFFAETVTVVVPADFGLNVIGSSLSLHSPHFALTTLLSPIE